MKPSDPNAEPPVSAPDYGRSLRGLGFNLLVRDLSLIHISEPTRPY